MSSVSSSGDIWWSRCRLISRHGTHTSLSSCGDPENWRCAVNRRFTACGIPTTLILIHTIDVRVSVGDTRPAKEVPLKKDIVFYHWTVTVGGQLQYCRAVMRWIYQPKGGGSESLSYNGIRYSSSPKWTRLRRDTHCSSHSRTIYIIWWEIDKHKFLATRSPMKALGK